MNFKIGYARVSTLEQNLDMQLDALNRAECDKIYQEKVSTRSDNRPERDRVVKDLREGDTLVVWKLDRYARSVKELTELADYLNSKGINFESLTEVIDTKSATGRFFYHIMAAIAEFERDKTRERTNVGLASARARGKKGGRPKGLSAKSMRKAKTAASLYKANDMSISEILEELEISKATFYKYLRVMGVEIMKKQLVYKTHQK